MTDLPQELRLEVKTSRSGNLAPTERDLEGIRPHGHLMALLRDRMLRGPRWVFVPARLLDPGPVTESALDRMAELEELARLVDRGWSDWLLDEEAWRRLLEQGVSGAASRARWCRRHHPPRESRLGGARREARLDQALARFSQALDEVAEGGTGAQAEGHIHQILIEDVLLGLGYQIRNNPVGVPDIKATLATDQRLAGVRSRLEDWSPEDEVLDALRRQLLDLEDSLLEKLLQQLG